MARDMPTTVRTEESLYKFYVHLAKKDRRGTSTLMAIVLEDFANEHGYEEWLSEYESILAANKNK